MKLVKLFITAALLSIATGVAIADSVIVTETSSWRSVPINVDSGAKTYTVVGTVPTDTTNYYYSYSGYRCFAVKRDIVGVDAVIFKAGISGGSDIYCYPE